MQAAYTIRRPAPVDRQIRHVERLRRVVRVLRGQEPASHGAKCRAFAGISTEVLLDEGGSKAVKTSGYRRMGGEEITRSCDRQCDFEGLPCLLHEIAGAFQDGECRVPFIQVADLWSEPERAKQSPSADP